MNIIQIVQFIQQPQGFKAFIPNKFPPAQIIQLDKNVIAKHPEAIRLLGKLDGITQLLPN